MSLVDSQKEIELLKPAAPSGKYILMFRLWSRLTLSTLSLLFLLRPHTKASDMFKGQAACLMASL